MSVKHLMEARQIAVRQAVLALKETRVHAFNINNMAFNMALVQLAHAKLHQEEEEEGFFRFLSISLSFTSMARLGRLGKHMVCA
jgi:hypothetical protein